MFEITDKVAVISVGVSKFGENWDKSADDMLIDAVYEALEDANLEMKQIQAGWIGTVLGGYGGTLLAEPLRWDLMPVTRVENNCASPLNAFQDACYSVAAGMYDVVLVAGVEKSKDSGMGSLTFPYGFHPVYAYIQAPASYGMAAQSYFRKYGISIEEGKRSLAKIAVKNHHNGTLSPKAHFQREITIEQVMRAPIIGYPLGLFDCCPTTDGAAAAIICRADMAGTFRDDPVLVKAMGLSVGKADIYTGRTPEADEFDYTLWNETQRAAEQVYAQLGITNPREEVDVAIVHDCFTISELVIYESLGFSARGQAKEDVDSGFFTLEGGLPVNTDGGLKAFGHPIGASGLRMLAEVYKQVQGTAGPRQVKGAKLGLAHCQGGNPTGGFQAAIVALGV
jgi:acetyl-CoA C-acetyltransferase